MFLMNLLKISLTHEDPGQPSKMLSKTVFWEQKSFLNE